MHLVRDKWSLGLGTLPVGGPEECLMGWHGRRKMGRESSEVVWLERLMLVGWRRDNVWRETRGLDQTSGGLTFEGWTEEEEAEGETEKEGESI